MRTVDAGIFVFIFIFVFVFVFVFLKRRFFTEDNEESGCRKMSEDGSLEKCSCQNIQQSAEKMSDLIFIKNKRIKIKKALMLFALHHSSPIYIFVNLHWHLYLSLHFLVRKSGILGSRIQVFSGKTYIYLFIS